jgi:NAD(P)-dependent dehydrogenase (short-subunit alcohol dehydrogenase family)
MAFNLDSGPAGKRVVVTGGSGGIGHEICFAFAAVGARVAVVDLDQRSFDAVVGEMEDGPHLALAHDLRPVAGRAALVDRITGGLGGLDVLVATAAVLVRRATIYDVSEEDWDPQHDVNLKVTFFFCQSVAQLMRDQGSGGRIIAFTSQGWQTGGFGGSVPYAASEGGMVLMSAALPARSPRTRSPSTPCRRAPPTRQCSGRASTRRGWPFSRRSPLGYLAAPSELAGSVLFLASFHARYVTGATIKRQRRLADVLRRGR